MLVSNAFILFILTQFYITANFKIIILVIHVRRFFLSFGLASLLPSGPHTATITTTPFIPKATLTFNTHCIQIQPTTVKGNPSFRSIVSPGPTLIMVLTHSPRPHTARLIQPWLTLEKVHQLVSPLP